MQALFDLLPVIAFFIAYKLHGIYVATGVLMIGMILLLALTRLRGGRISTLMWVSAVLVLLLGAATLILHDPVFLKWKPTVYFWVMAAIFLGSSWVGRMPLTQALLQSALTDSAPVARVVWIKLNVAWTVFFALLGALNLYVAYRLPESTWVNFKVYGLTVLLLVFAVLQALWLGRQSAKVAA
jgi:intracellular septation protein